ncbi:MAG: outer membrane lipoprotein carrier protein LolA [Nitrospirae bacterium]|nr:outer membrane lipoprotein carrier protein LolA [Nitrospirota bacterium]
MRKPAACLSPALTRRGWGGFGKYSNTPQHLLLQSGGLLRPICILIFILAVNLPVSFGSDADAKLARIQKAYEGIVDIKGAFTQKSTIKDLKKTETFKGEFFIKPPMRMKWIYKGTAAQDLIINNDTVLIIKKSENQAYKSRFDKATYGQTPVALLGGFGNIRDEFIVSSTGDSLLLRPKKTLGTVTSIKVRVSDDGFPVRAFTITDKYGNVIEIDLSGVTVNSGVRDSMFDLAAPKGVNVMEQGF